jgi:hypothetical protein
VSVLLRRALAFGFSMLIVGSAVGIGPFVRPASAKVFSLFPADDSFTTTDTFESDGALFAIGTTDFLGATICVVSADTVQDPNGGNSCGAAWGGKNNVVGLGTFTIPIAGPPLKPGTWRLLADGGTFPGADVVSIPFTVVPCTVCDASIAQAIVQDWKDLATEKGPLVGGICALLELNGELGKVKIAGGVVREGLTGGFTMTSEFSAAAVSFGLGFLDQPSTSEEYALQLAQHVACRAQLMYRDIANDPPDPNTHLVEPPHFEALPSPSDAVRAAFITAFDQLQAYGTAERVAFERYTAAINASDSGGIAIQAKALATYGAQVVEAMDASAQAARALGTEMDADPNLNDPVITPSSLADILAVRARVTTDGFNATELAQLQGFGLDAAAIAGVRALFAVDRSAAPTDVSLGDELRTGADAIDAASPAFDTFARAAAVAAAKADVTAQAAFTYTPSEGATPLEVTFTDTTSNPDGGPLGYAWDFDEGTTSTDASPVHTFTDVRSYQVRLTVTDVDSGLTSLSFQTVTVTPPGTPPVAFFQLPRYVYRTGDTIHLTDLSTDLEGPIVSRHWFGSGQFTDLEGTETDVTFTQAGTNDVRLVVTDADGWTRDYGVNVGVFDDIPVPSRGGCAAAIPGSTLDSSGNEYLLAFPRNNESRGVLSLYLTGDVAASGFVEIPGIAFEHDFSVTPGNVTAIDIPLDAQAVGSDFVDRRAVRVCADHEVTAYGANVGGSTTDAYLGLPTDALGPDYVVMSIGADVSHFADVTDERSQLTVVGIQDGTLIQVTPAIAVGPHPAGVPFTVDLDRLMTFQLRADHDREDLTGTILHANHPIAVFGGASCTDIPFGASACDHVVEQLPPTRTWGTDFSVVSLAARTGGDIVRVLARQPGTNVVVDGSTVATLSAGHFVELDLPSDTTHVIHASHPVLVAQFAKSLAADTGIGTGDPFMMLITPTAQFADHYTVISPDFGYSHYLNLVVRSGDEAACRLDGEALTVPGVAIGPSGYVGVREPVPAGTHNLTCPNPFGVSVYGWAVFESYGYPGGTQLATLDDDRSPVAVDDIASTTADTSVDVPVLANDSDPDADPISVSDVTQPTHGTASIQLDGTIRYTPTAGYSGPDAFTYSISDGRGGTATATVAMTVDAAPPANRAPTIAAIGNAIVPELVPFGVATIGSDPDGDALTYSVTSGPTGLSVNASTGAVSWTPTEAQGPGVYPVTIRATDAGLLFGEASFTITVTEVNAAPSLAAIDDRTVHRGETVTLTASATDPDLPANTLLYSLLSGPANATLAAAGGGFSWTPSVADVGDHTVTIGVSDGAGGTATTSFTIHVVVDATTLSLGGDVSGQYSDPATITAKLEAGSTPVVGAAVAISFAGASTSATTNASGIASATFAIPGPSGSVARGASFAGTLSLASSGASGTFTVTREDADLVYSGDTIALAGSTVALRATVTDSAASGYAGLGAEGASGTIGDITRARVAFSIYAAATCLSGSPIATVAASVVDTGPTGDGIGTAAASWSSGSEGTFCIAIALVGASSGSANGYYVARPAEPAGLAVYVDTSGKVTGGGWTAVTGGRANFGFNASSIRGKVKGNLVFVERTTYHGRAAILIVKSNEIDALRVTGSTFPITAALTGKATFRYLSAVDGSTFFESGNATFTATVIDANLPGGRSDCFAIRVEDKTHIVVVDLATTLLGGGNVVAHLL